MRSFLLAAVASLAAVATAQATDFPKGVGEPTGNAISKPGLDEQVPAGKPYKVTWDPTTEGTVTILLLRGPSTNVVPIQYIAQSVPNTGSYEWNVPTTLEDDKTHYGIQLIVDSNKQYQYSTQFGVSNPGGPKPSASAGTDSVAPTGTAAGTDAGTATYPQPTESVTVITATEVFATLSLIPTDLGIPKTTAVPTTVETKAATPTYAPPESNVTTPTPAAPSQTGAASTVRVGLGLLLGAVAVAFAL